MNSKMTALSERLFHILGNPAFLAMKGQANEMPIFIQAYESRLEGVVRQMIGGLAAKSAYDTVVPERIRIHHGSSITLWRSDSA